jgi:hypothetical protein
MDRREALYSLGMITGMAFFASSSLVSCSSKAVVSDKLTEEDVQLLNEIGEIIISVTADSPGAKVANTGKYVQAIVNDCMNEKDKTKFLEGWQHMQILGREQYNKDINNLSGTEINTYLTSLDKYSSIGEDESKADLAISAFHIIKQLTVGGYFTSEVGATQALRYDPIPGKFVGVIPYEPGDKVWARDI